MKRDDLNIMANIKMIEKLKANLLSIIAEFYHLLTKGSNVAQAAILNCISGAVIISESHLAIHTWPEYGYAAVDVFTCGDKINPWTAFKYLEEVFKAERSESIEVPRGMVEKIRNFSPKNLGKITFKPETIKEEVC